MDADTPPLAGHFVAQGQEAGLYTWNCASRGPTVSRPVPLLLDRAGG